MLSISTTGLDNLDSMRAHNEQQLVSQLIRAGAFHAILLYLSDTYPPDGSKRAPHALGFICTTHTCSSMRAVALDMSELWAPHVCAFASEEAFDELCRRAKERPLTISNERENFVDKYSIRQYMIPAYYLSAHTRARCGTLSIEDAEQILDTLEAHEFPLLHTMALRCKQLRISYGTSNISIRAAQLHHVTLFNVYLPLAWHTLVSLHIDGVGWQTPLPADVMLSMLESAVHLRYLKLCHFACQSKLPKTVHLPSLVHLVLQGASAVNIASRIVHPLLKVADITQRASVNVSALPALASIYTGSDFWGNSSQEAPKAYVLTFGEPGRYSDKLYFTVQAGQSIRDMQTKGLELAAQYSESLPSEPALKVVANIDGVMMTPGSHIEITETIVRTHARLAPSMLRAIEVLHLATWPAQVLNWRVLCEPFPLAHTLVLGSEQPRANADDGLTAALAHVAPDGSLLLPKLHTIVVERKTPWPPQERARFREMLAVRAKRGAPILCVRDVVEPIHVSTTNKRYSDELIRVSTAKKEYYAELIRLSPTAE